MSVNKILRLKLFAALLFIFILSNFAAAESGKSAEEGSEILSVDFTDYYLSVQAQDVDINDLFKEITSKTGVRIIAASPLDCRISIDFKKKGFTRGMKLILTQLSPGEHQGNFKLGKTFSDSIYTIRRTSEQELSARKEKASTFNTEGEKLLSEGKDYQAYSYFIKALRSDPDFLPAHKNLASIYKLWEDYENLSQRLERIVNLEPDNARNYRLLADAYRMDYRHDKAIENYSIFITKSDESIEVEKAKAITAQMNTNKNRDYYQKISEARGIIWAKKFEKAREILNRAVHADPSNTKAYELMAITYEIEGNFKTAVEWRKKIAALAPDDPKNLLLLGRDLRIFSKHQAASEYLTKAKLLSKSEYMTLLVEKELKLVK
jgi:tetratricopeptide (TPR) repeat protein